MYASKFLLLIASLLVTVQAFWLADIQHQGVAPFAGGGYKVFRNVKDYGAKGDGSSDDTAAINAAIMDGSRCGQGCVSAYPHILKSAISPQGWHLFTLTKANKDKKAGTTTTPALVYFPAGTYVISGPLHPAYFTQMVGDATSPPTIKATANWSGGLGLIDADPYYTSSLNWGSTTVFYRQIRNFVIDTTAIPSGNAATGIHWPTAQATSLQNIVFNMPTGGVHVGLFIEEGSAGFITDLTFNGGNIGASIGNQQYTMRNLVFNGCNTAISQLWDWGWTYIGLSINNCGTGIDISAGGSSAVAVGSLTLIDSTISDTSVGINSARTGGSTPSEGDSVILENVKLSNVQTAVKGPSGTVLNGGSTTISAWGSGSQYGSGGTGNFEGSFTANSRPGSLLNGANYRTMSKPQYESLSSGDIVSARSSGAKGDGSSDDTQALQNGINSAASAGKVFFLDYGVYKITDTVTIPAGAKIVGEAYPTIMSSGNNFASQDSPRAVLKVGSSSGQSGRVELSDFLVSTQGAQGGAILIEWNLASDSSNPSGLWDVHTRIGGFTGSNQQLAQCPKNPGNNNPPSQCIAAFMSMHITSGASGLYMENNWFWTADHDIDAGGNQQIDIYTGRGLLIESTSGNFWLIGTAVEHHALYQYSLVGTKNIFLGQIQTETAYWQPTPSVPAPFSINASYNDPSFPNGLKSGWGFHAKDSTGILVYGAGLYSFFSEWDTSKYIFFLFRVYVFCHHIISETNFYHSLRYSCQWCHLPDKHS